MSVRAVVINIHDLGATVRLMDGTLAVVAAEELAAHRAVYLASRDGRRPIEVDVRRPGRHAVARLAGSTVAETPESLRTDIAFEMRLGAFLKSTQEWAPADRPPPAERHFIRKKRRAGEFEARNPQT